MNNEMLANRQFVLEIEAQIANVVKGQERPLRMSMIALLAGGHILLEGVPGVGKTLLLRSIARAVQGVFQRVQGNSDLKPNDIVGYSRPRFTGDDVWVPGPLLTPDLAIFLMDEINRCPTKTQSVLLEAMQEKQVTHEGKNYQLSPIFTLVATRNPLERGETWELPEAQRDRFLFETEMGYPSRENEMAIAKDPAYRSMSKKIEDSIRPVIDRERVLSIRAMVESEIIVSDSVLDYGMKLIEATRTPAKFGIQQIKVRDKNREEMLDVEHIISAGVSPRGLQGFVDASKFVAWLAGSDAVLPQHIQSIAHDLLLHRIFFASGTVRRSLVAKTFLNAVLNCVEHR